MTLAVLLALPAGGSVSAQQAGWTKVYDAPSPNFAAVGMFDDERGVAAATGGLLYTTDGGRSWQEGSTDQAVALGGAFGSTA